MEGNRCRAALGLGPGAWGCGATSGSPLQALCCASPTGGGGPPLPGTAPRRHSSSGLLSLAKSKHSLDTCLPPESLPISAPASCFPASWQCPGVHPVWGSGCEAGSRGQAAWARAGAMLPPGGCLGPHTTAHRTAQVGSQGAQGGTQTFSTQPSTQATSKGSHTGVGPQEGGGWHSSEHRGVRLGKSMMGGGPGVAVSTSMMARTTGHQPKQECGCAPGWGKAARSTGEPAWKQGPGLPGG